MNLTALIQSAHTRAPAEARGTITFTPKTGSAFTGTATGVPAHGTPADGFKAGLVIREKNRRLTVTNVDGVPSANMTATWDGIPWTVSSVSPFMPQGSTTAAFYRVTLSR